MYRPRYFEELDLQPADKKVGWFIATPLLAIVIGAAWFGASALPRSQPKWDATSSRAADLSTGSLSATKVVSR